jgi:monoamine oxidase
MLNYNENPNNKNDKLNIYSNNIIYDCIIIGSGASGLQCANSLITEYNMNTKNILVLEAQNYIGGRIHQINDFIKGVKIDVGAEILHGSNTELKKFADNNNENFKKIFRLAHGDGGPSLKDVNKKYGLYFIRDKDGNKKILRYDDNDTEFIKLNESLWNLHKLNKDNIDQKDSLYDYLVKCNINDEMLTMAEAGFSNTFCTNSKELSLKRCVEWCNLLGDIDNDNDYMFNNSMSCVIDTLKKDIQIQLNSAVTHIEYQPIYTNTNNLDLFSELIKIKTIQGINYYTKSLVITSSPKVLKSNLMHFSPPLSNNILDAIQTTNMHNITKIILKFSRRCWPKNLHGMIISDNKYLLPEIWFKNVEDIADINEPAKAYAVGFLTSEYANKLSSLTKKDIFHQCIIQLDEIFSILEHRHMNADPSDIDTECPSNIPSPLSVFIDGMLWSWNQENQPYIGGGYVSPLSNTQTELMDNMRLPYGNGNIFFAGEATNLPGSTVHDAMESGLRAAKLIFNYIHNNKN